MIPVDVLLKTLVAGLLASLACGIGALPLAIRRLDPARHTGIGYGFAGGLMFAASVYNLILPGLTIQSHRIVFADVWPVVVGILLGAAFLWMVEHFVDEDHFEGQSLKNWGGKAGILIFIAMFVHSIPEGIAVGVGYTSDAVYGNRLGDYIAVAIGIHNIPEGLAVAIPLRSAGASINRCFWAAFLTSLPQPIAAVPAAIMSWLFQPLMPVLMGFAAGAMIFVILLENHPGGPRE